MKHCSYVDEGFWIADGAQSSLRRRVGAVHRTVSTYINTFLTQGLTLERLDEPGYRPGEHVDHRGPVYLMGTFIRS